MKIFLRFPVKVFLAMILCCSLGCGCSERDETHHPLFQKGRKARSVGDGKTAAECFRTLLFRRPGAVRCHLELAGVYDELLNDPLMAAAHYRIYLELVPDAADRETIRMWQTAAEKRFCDSRRGANSPAPAKPPETPEFPVTPELPAASAGGETASEDSPGAHPLPVSSESGTELAELRAENERLRSYLEDCKKQLARLGTENRKLRSSVSSAGEETAPKASARPASTPPETYTVVAGDTLSGISWKVYGSSRFYREILRANPGVGERSLRPGKVLRIPPRPDAAPKTDPNKKEVKE